MTKFMPSYISHIPLLTYERQ